jgi:hypothetical protein
MDESKPISVTFQNAKRLSGLGLTKLWELAKHGDLQTIKVGRRTLILYGSLEKLLLPEG